ncbi:glycosyltransferase family 4 protein [Jannaschia pohangensis]|uniref:Glycosyl transferases group 1 n=1 Tax=Jannaschia pohangensis TaxID=390807 RepID=A0A1I3NXA2_9RHOB|nr:glycosyltransferase family 4 protein [Jannaschia pohangensis]SFJ13797.1 Glycosyl transferases group 1 [Jannaschia pohangensis]
MTGTSTVAFAVPGDIHALTGGYIYDFKLMTALAATGLDVRHLEWGDSFPHPTPMDAEQAMDQLRTLGPDQAALIDGLAYGALDTAELSTVTARLFALVHHPLALEPGLEPEVADRMAARERANLGLARHIFVTSPHTGDMLRRHYGVAPDRVTVVKPGFGPPNDTLTQKADPPLILSVGLLARRKGHDILLRALARIADLDWQADIVGRDHEAGMTATLTALISDLGLSKRVRLSGEVSDQALHERYGRATVFALATRYEGYGIVFGEAMGHGLPIVTTRAGAVPETVGSGPGLLVDPDDAEAFAGALRRMLTEPEMRSKCARASLRAASGLTSWAESAALVRDTIIHIDDLARGR